MYFLLKQVVRVTSCWSAWPNLLPGAFVIRPIPARPAKYLRMEERSLSRVFYSWLVLMEKPWWSVKTESPSPSVRHYLQQQQKSLQKRSSGKSVNHPTLTNSTLFLMNKHLFSIGKGIHGQKHTDEPCFLLRRCYSTQDTPPGAEHIHCRDHLTGWSQSFA